jgi:hypothetical protein
MNRSVILVAFLFTLFATAIMSYISMVMPIGPWVELILVLAGTIVFRLFLGYEASGDQAAEFRRAVGLTTVAGGVGGIVATVCGFAFPTLYFLQPELFAQWLTHPFYFSVLMAVIVLSGGAFAFLVVHGMQERMLKDNKMTFPIGQMVSKVIAAQNQLRKALELFTGMVLTFIFGLLQRCIGLIPQLLTLVPRISVFGVVFPPVVVRMDLLPIFVAVGYVAGHILTVPLAIGMVSKVFVLEPLQRIFFAQLGSPNFILAIGSGMVLQGAFLSFLRFPPVIMGAHKRFVAAQIQGLLPALFSDLKGLLLCGGVLGLVSLHFLFFGFSLAAIGYILLFSAVCVYQLLVIGGKIGLAPFGRFATFVMVPGIFLFGFNALQVTLVSLFVGLSGGIAVDLMFGRKMAQITGIDQRQVAWFQFFGLVVSALSVGALFWVLINHFGLGSEDLVAQRAQARALLVNAYIFDYTVIALGACFGFVLNYLRMSALLVFTGLLFPIQFSLMLIAGGLLTYVPYDKQEWDPFWSGVFAAGSLWIMLRAII